MGAPRRLVMPKLGLTMTEGTVVEWPLAEGARFAKDEVYVVVENDKVANEIAAPEDGRLLKILVPKGETVPVGTALAEWEPDAEGPEEAAPAPESRPNWRAASALELAAARKLAKAQQEVPHFYLAAEIDVGRLQALRERRNAGAPRARITLTHLIVAAVARALARHPAANRVWQDDGFLDMEGADVGVAVHTDQGLMVPVLRAADRKALDQLAAETTALVEKARTRTLAADEVGGGAITVSNAGMHDVTYMASIINPGQAAILGVGSERRLFRPDAQGAPRLAREIGVVLSCDHRVLDGVRAAAFLNAVRAALEAPEPLFD
jgi:pyruvate dehydrogenase E2 component (dihydrolipoamide acetyltransferase)